MPETNIPFIIIAIGLSVSRTTVSCTVQYGNIIVQAWVQIRICIPKLFVFKITKGHIFVFGLYLKSICKYNQIHINITILPIKGKTLPDINWLRSLDRMFFIAVVCMVNCGQAALRKLAHTQAGQTLASINEWEASEAYL